MSELQSNNFLLLHSELFLYTKKYSLLIKVIQQFPNSMNHYSKTICQFVLSLKNLINSPYLSN